MSKGILLTFTALLDIITPATGSQLLSKLPLQGVFLARACQLQRTTSHIAAILVPRTHALLTANTVAQYSLACMNAYVVFDLLLKLQLFVCVLLHGLLVVAHPTLLPWHQKSMLQERIVAKVLPLEVKPW